jgi:tRNA(fMet)-specific endonuclease VapC
MSLYLLDTCTLSDLFEGFAKTEERLRATSPSQVAISTITVMEVLYGFALNSKAERKFASAFQSLCKATQVIPFDQAAAIAAAGIRARLKAKGTPVGSWDLLIAATAIAHKCVLVTSNIREFERIETLKLENWR